MTRCYAPIPPCQYGKCNNFRTVPRLHISGGHSCSEMIGYLLTWCIYASVNFIYPAHSSPATSLMFWGRKVPYFTLGWTVSLLRKWSNTVSIRRSTNLMRQYPYQNLLLSLIHFLLPTRRSNILPLTVTLSVSISVLILVFPNKTGVSTINGSIPNTRMAIIIDPHRMGNIFSGRGGVPVRSLRSNRKTSRQNSRRATFFHIQKVHHGTNCRIFVQKMTDFPISTRD